MAKPVVRAAVAGDVPGDVVVGQHPGGRARRPARARRGSRRSTWRSAAASHGAAEEVEVERGVQLVGAQVAGEPRRGSGSHTSPMSDARGRCSCRRSRRQPGRRRGARRGPRTGAGTAGRRVEVGQRRVLGEQRGGVDADAVDAPVEPEPQDVLELLADLRVVPVEVGLLGGEQVQVPLARRRRPGSRRGRRRWTASRSAAARRPRRGPGGTRTGPARRAGPARQRLLEPGVLVGACGSGTMSMMIRMPSACASAISCSASARVPKTGRCRGSRRRRSRASAIGDGYHGLNQIASTPRSRR